MEQQFGQWLRYYRKQHHMNQKEVADALGVGQTTIANYENNSRFPDRQKLVSLAKLFNASLDEILGVRVKKDPMSCGEYPSFGQALSAEETLEHILAGKELEAWDKIHQIVCAGTGMAEIYLHLLTPLLVLTGDLWADGSISVAEEHIVSNAVKGYMERMRVLYPKASPQNSSCICATVPGESHSIGIRMLRDLLEQSGWKGFFLGDKVPTDQLIRFAASLRPDLLAFSVSLNENIDAANLVIERVRREIRLARIPIMLGGRVFLRDDVNRNNSPADFVASSLNAGLEFASQITQPRIHSR
ncbi:cobalamin-dependent protein [Marispirochaeta sp.]|uniref:cobalamin-dependent protein n=1 Tax=Marispirochaeta sp. TaxID=2038653 RepID=UPI0029C83CE4|nr:cobalamin-dependent protein [Marispirochaeta sp.]